MWVSQMTNALAFLSNDSHAMISLAITFIVDTTNPLVTAFIILFKMY